MLNHRCCVCNSVSSEAIETNPGDWKNVNFVRDSLYATDIVCTSCKEQHEELMLEYEQNDSVWGWKYQSTPDNVIIVDFTPEEEREDE